MRENGTLEVELVVQFLDRLFGRKSRLVLEGPYTSLNLVRSGFLALLRKGFGGGDCR